MVDANGTRFHLLLGEDDWLRTRRRDVEWDGVRNEIRLWPRVFRFAGGTSEAPIEIGQRRGAARDAFGNWYWIAPDERSILVRSSGSQNVSAFWPDPSTGAGESAPDTGGFRPRRAPEAAVLPLRGLAVTDDHYLAVGTPGEAGKAGVLIFDLYAGSAPRLYVWPIPFDPFDIASRDGGGVWILDRRHRRIWQLGPRFEVVAPDASPAPATGEPRFVNADGSEPPSCTAHVALNPAHAWEVPACDPVAIAPLDKDAVLVLERDDGTKFGRVHLLVHGAAQGDSVSLRAILEHIDTGAREEPFTLVAHDFALGARQSDDPDAWSGRLFVVAADGRQAYAFGVERTASQLKLDAQPDYYPMRLFGGRGLVIAGDEPWYDSGSIWVRLQQQKRPRFVEVGEVASPVFDSGEPSCVWHRLMLDACIPPGTAVDVLTRAADESLDLTDWQREPQPRMRGDGSELPYVPNESGAARGTWELLFQKAVGRYLQVKLVLRGDARSTPRVRALRAWYPRFSYLDHYLPAVYREDAQSASFLDRFLANIEGMFTATEDRMAAAQMLFDVATAPPETLDWLASWFGVALDPSWEDARRRLFLRHAMDFFAVRGTNHGLQLALRLALDECIDDRLFDASPRAARQAAPLRIIERFRARRTPRALLGDVTTAMPRPQTVVSNAPWQPGAGGEELHRRYREALNLSGSAEFPLVAADAPHGWRAFAEQALGFVPSTATAERTRWRKFVHRQHNGSVSAVNHAHGTTGVTFASLRVVTDESTLPGLAEDWREYVASTPDAIRGRWQAFLARRYRNTDALNSAWRTHWRAFAHVPLPDRLPPDGPALRDWYQFEGSVMAMHRAAHRFTVMLPIRRSTRSDVAARQRRLALAQRVLDLEKPAHTIYDMRFYWAMFRLGEARLGDDTLLDRGSRSPELMAPMVLGEGYLAEAFLSAPAGLDAPDRLQLGRDRVGRSARVGGP